MLEGQSRPGEGWGKSDDREQSRRSIYIFVKRCLAVPELELLDVADNTSSCERRMVSTTGPQALTFLNGAFIQEQARTSPPGWSPKPDKPPRTKWSEHSRSHWVGLRGPKSSCAAVEFLKKQERQIQADAVTTDAKAGLEPRDARQRALEAFCLVILNMNEFVYTN